MNYLNLEFLPGTCKLNVSQGIHIWAVVEMHQARYHIRVSAATMPLSIAKTVAHVERMSGHTSAKPKNKHSNDISPQPDYNKS